MSFPYPQDRHKDRREKGEQPYKGAREALGQQEAGMRAEAESFGEAELRQSDEARGEALEDRLVARLREVGGAREDARDQPSEPS